MSEKDAGALADARLKGPTERQPTHTDGPRHEVPLGFPAGRALFLAPPRPKSGQFFAIAHVALAGANAVVCHRAWGSAVPHCTQTYFTQGGSNGASPTDNLPTISA